MNQDKPDHLNTLQKISGVLLVIITLFGAILPIAGFSFNLGYLSVFGMDADSFPRSIADLWQYSFMMSVLWLGTIVKPYSTVLNFYFAAVIFLVLFTTALVILKMLGKPNLSKAKIKTILNKLDRFEDLISNFGELKGFIYVFLALVIIPLAFYLLLFDPYQRGKQFSQNRMDYFIESGCSGKTWDVCFSYLDPDNPLVESYSGLLVSASSTHIAIFDGEKISIIPRNPDYVLTRNYKVSTKATEQH